MITISSSAIQPNVADSPRSDNPQKKPSALDLVGKLAKSGAKGKAKETKPDVNDPALDEAIASFAKHKQAHESSEALMNAAADQIRAAVLPKRLELCAAAGKVHASVTVNGKLTLTQTCKYSKVPQEQSAALEAAFGDDFSRFFSDTLVIGLKPESANSEDVLNAMMEKLGEEFFQQHFDVRRDFEVTDLFHHDYTTRPAIQKIATPFIQDQTIKPYSASLKVK